MKKLTLVLSVFLTSLLVQAQLPADSLISNTLEEFSYETQVDYVNNLYYSNEGSLDSAFWDTRYVFFNSLVKTFGKDSIINVFTGNVQRGQTSYIEGVIYSVLYLSLDDRLALAKNLAQHVGYDPSLNLDEKLNTQVKAYSLSYGYSIKGDLIRIDKDKVKAYVYNETKDRVYVCNLLTVK